MMLSISILNDVILDTSLDLGERSLYSLDKAQTMRLRFLLLPFSDFFSLSRSIFFLLLKN